MIVVLLSHRYHYKEYQYFKQRIVLLLLLLSLMMSNDVKSTRKKIQESNDSCDSMSQLI